MENLFSRLTKTALVVACSCTATAFAQENDSGFVVEEVIVTANKREQNIQDVPMSVSAFNSDFLKDTGANSLGALENYTPSLKIQTGTDSRSTSIRIRGIGSVGTNSGIDPSVGIFIDGIYQGRAGMSISDLIDIQQIEVLRGPQGSLYGKNTAAGAITITTKKPISEFESEIEAVYNSEDKAEIRGMVNVPLGEINAMRVSAFLTKGDHQFENSYNNEGTNNADKWGVKSKFLFDMSDAGEIILNIDYSKEDTDCCALSVIEYDGLSVLNAPITEDPSAEWQSQLGFIPGTTTPYLNYISFESTEVDGDGNPLLTPDPDPFGDDYWFNGELFNKVDVGGVAAEWNYELESDSSLTFINAWRTYTSESAIDGDFTAYQAVTGTSDVELDQYSSELRLTSPGGQTWDYVGGLYAYYSELDSVGTFSMYPALINNANLLGTLGQDESLNTDTNTYTTTSYAAFGQLVWNINEQLVATLGMRYTYEKKEREGSQVSDPEIVQDIPPVAGPNIFLDDDRSDSAVSPSFILSYFINDDIMTYGSVSRGFKSGGFDQRRLEEGETGEFEEEIATNYELGWKGTWMDRRLTVNGTFFFVDYDDFQSQSFDGASLKVTNAGSLESYGAELELMFIPTMSTVIGSNIGYNKAEYKEFEGGQCTVNQAFYQYYVIEEGTEAPGTTGSCSQDLSGKPLDNAPEWTVSSFVQYEQPIGDALMAKVRLEHNYVDAFFLDQDLDQNLYNDEVDLVNLRLTLSNTNGDWEVALWGQNLLDEQYYVMGIDIPTVGGYAGVTAPQALYGATLRYNFY